VKESQDNHIFGTPFKFIELQDASLPYWKIGRGPDLVFIHGWPLDGRTWRVAVELLKDRFTCHVVDLPRAGISSWSNETRIGVKSYGDIVYECVQQMNIDGEKFGFIGQNTGGSFARLAAARMPERLLGIVLGNTEIPYRHSLHLWLLFSLGGIWCLDTLLKIVLMSRLGRSSLLLMATGHRRHLHGEFTDLFLRPLINERRLMSAATDTLRAISARDFNCIRQAHGKIQAPVKLVWGAQDVWFPNRAAQLMLKEFLGPTEYVELSPGRLMIHEEQAIRFAEEIATHFK